MSVEVPWLPIDLCPADGVARTLLLPDGREVIGARARDVLGRKRDGWEIHTRHDYEEPVYEEPLRGGFVVDPYKRGAALPERKQIGTRKAVMWLVGDLPQALAPTHYRPNDTILGDPKADPR